MGRGAMAADSDTFSNSGPKGLTHVCWNNSYHRTAVVSCLVNGVSTMQRDKAKKRKPRLANSWWESFDFSLLETLTNRDDGSIYGAVYEYNHYNRYQRTPHLGKPPRYVIAFRGTMLSSETWISDVKQDIRCFLNILNQGRRFDNAKRAIENVLSYHEVEAESVWLAGHSLGAGIALLAGKTMARSGSLLQTYAFNPPHSGLLLEYLFDSEIFKGRVRIARSFAKTTAASLIHLKIQEDDLRTSAWTPQIYVNQSDPICTEFIGDFKHKNYMPTIGASKVESDGARISFRSLAFGRRTPSDFPGEPIQLLSSADMTKNMNVMAGLRAAHGLKQWWKQDPALWKNWEIHRIRPSI
ncbi:unnamed protein product [Brassica rapa subsp. trilocularis]